MDMLRGKLQAGQIGVALREFREGVDALLFPRRCAACDAALPGAADGVCAECRQQFVRIREPRCCRCGKHIGSEEGEYCMDCRAHRHSYVRGVALYEYRSVRTSIYRYKYGGRREYGAYFAREMARCLGRELLSWRPDVLVPVPLYAARERRRGYNQAAVLAGALGDALGIPVDMGLVRRVRATRPMKELGLKERQINLKNAFLITQDVVKYDSVILIDDIYTTGSTIDAIARLLRMRGVERVYYAALSIGDVGR